MLTKNFKISFVICLILISDAHAFCQNDEYLKHIESIKKDNIKRNIKNNCSSNDSSFLDYSIKRIIKPNEIIYISNRKLLDTIPITKCTKSSLEMKSIRDGQELLIEITLKDFDTVLNKIETKENGDIISINGSIPYGASYSVPTTQIQNINIKIGGKKINIPDSVYLNLYEPYIDESNGFSQKIQAFSSIDHKYIYLYIYGGFGADHYFSKLIFDNDKFITKWVASYYPLTCFGCFSENFIGF